MIPAQIEKEVLIEAPVEVVWRVVTEPHQIRQWFSDQAELDLKVGGDGRLVWTGKASYDIRIEAVEPLQRFSFRWVHPEGSTPDPTNSTLVEFSLRPEAGGTRLRIIESGFDRIDWTDADKARHVAEHTRGWEECLERLESVASRQARIRARG